jgi:hypothetical protein
MAWRLSRFRVGDVVEVLTKEEILATLDERGCLDGMPFMPEMLPFCGQRFRVRAVAHKTCDTARQTWKGRRLQTTVHLEGLRCDGSAHGGCQAECSLFWKDGWLKRPEDDRSGPPRPIGTAPAARVGGCSETQIFASTSLAAVGDGTETRYSCQATMLHDATEPLAAWDVRQYVLDVMTGNRSAGRVLCVVWLASLRWLLPRVPVGYRLVKFVSDWMHRSLGHRESPALNGKIARGKPTPVGRLNLNPGELVRIKSQEEIELTLDESGKNRGLCFDPEEMAPYCGRQFRVWKSVSRIIDEPTGAMLVMKQPCVMLEGVECSGDYANCRLNCPRAIPSYWRELWLERVEDEQAQTDESRRSSVVSTPCGPR